MTRKIRRIILWIFVVLFAVSSAAIVFLALGFRFDFRSFKITKTGGIYIATSIPDAKIYINDKYEETTGGILKYSRLLENLIPKNYDVFVYKEGYYPWNKTVSVRAGEVAEIKNIVLFPVNLKIEKITAPETKSIIKDFPKIATSTDGFRIKKGALEQYDDAKNEWILLNSETKLLALSPDKNSLLYANANEVKVYSLIDKKSQTVLSLPSRVDYIAWFLNSSYILAVSNGDLIAIELDNLGSKRNSAKLLYNISEPLYYDLDNDILYFRRDKSLYKTHLYTQ